MSSIQPVTFYVPATSAEPIEVGVAHSGLRMVLVSREAIGMLDNTWGVLGVYFLLGAADDPDRYQAYVGEVGRRTLLVRLREHAAHKEWWSRALLIASASDEFNSAEIGWLEGRLYDVLNNALAADVMNRGRPGDDSIARRDRGVLERYVEPIMAALRACGAPPDTADQKPAPRGRRKQARYKESVKDLIDGGLLKAGTRLQPLRRGLTGSALVLDSGELEVDGDAYGSVSAAAVAVSGKQSEPGWNFWGAPSGDGGFVPLHDLRMRLRERDDSPPTPAAQPVEPTASSAEPSAEAEIKPPPSAVSSTHRKRAKRSARSRPDEGRHRQPYDVKMADLIGYGDLRPGEALSARHKGSTYETELLDDGRARGLRGAPDGSVSTVAKQLIGREVNGWDFWSVERAGRAVRLRDIRARRIEALAADSTDDGAGADAQDEPR